MYALRNCSTPYFSRINFVFRSVYCFTLIFSFACTRSVDMTMCPLCTKHFAQGCVLGICFRMASTVNDRNPVRKILCPLCTKHFAQGCVLGICFRMASTVNDRNWSCERSQRRYHYGGRMSCFYGHSLIVVYKH